MNHGQVLFEYAEEARIGGRPRKAIGILSEAIPLLEDEEAKAAIQMQAVCFRTIGRNKRAIQLLVILLRNQQLTQEQRAHISRDLGEAYSQKRSYSLADEHLRRSHRLYQSLCMDEELAATIGFQGRNSLRQGNLEVARGFFGTADTILREGTNRHYELYNLLPYAHCLALVGRRQEMRGKLNRVRRLIPECGNRSHTVKAYIIQRCARFPRMIRPALAVSRPFTK